MLHGSLQALYLHRLKRCHVQAGPVLGATLADGLDACTLMVATQQLRVHHAQASQLCVCVSSDPVIEHCSGLRFAPLRALPYEQYEELACAARISDDRNKWRAVQDFQNPGHASSPNWSVLPEAERVVPQNAWDEEEAPA